jgi:hypothetical protein
LEVRAPAVRHGGNGFFCGFCFLCAIDALCFAVASAKNHRPQSCKTMQSYRIYVRLKRGGQHTGRDLHNGSPPVAGTELNVPLVTGRSVKARIGSYHEGSKRIGNPVSVVINVYADEI